MMVTTTANIVTIIAYMNNPPSASPVPTKVSINFWIASFHAKPATKPNAVVTKVIIIKFQLN